jgi:hypothetical protein
MRYDYIDDVYFRTDESGQTLYFRTGAGGFPFGEDEPPYLIPDEAARLRVRRGLIWTQRLWELGLALCFYIVLACIGFLWLRWAAIGVVPVLLAGLAHALIERRLVRGLVPVSGSCSWRERRPVHLPRLRWNYWRDLAVAVPLAGVSLAKVGYATQHSELVAGFFGVAVFLLAIGNAILWLTVEARSAGRSPA